MEQPGNSSVQPLSPERMELLIQAFPASFTSLGPLAQRISIRIYRLLAAGRPVSRRQLATELQLSTEQLDTVLSQWPGVYYDGKKRIVGYWGLALAEMKHRFEVAGRALYTWCAWDGLFIPELIGKLAKVTSSCEVGRDTIQLTVAPDRQPLAIEPASTVISFVEPEEEKISQDIISNFCHDVHFFTSPQAGSEWIAERPGTFLISVQDAMGLGQAKNRLQSPQLF